MLSFFDSFTSFISTIWGYFQNLLTLTIEVLDFLLTTYMGVGVVLPSLPTMLALGMTCTISIMVVRFVLLK